VARAEDQAAPRRRAALGLLAAVVLLALAAGCGTISAPKSTAGASAAQQAQAGRRLPWPPGGSRTLARAVGRQLLARLELPPGSRRTGRRGSPRRAEVIGSLSLVDLSRFFIMPMPMQAAETFFRGHAPVGLLANGTDTVSDRSGVTEEGVSFSFRVPPTGITSDTELLVSLAPGPDGRTIGRADAEVVWYPPRTRAEYLRAAAIRSARITASFMNPEPRRFAKVIRSRRAIARLAVLLNRMRATDNSIMFCPAIDASYHVTFIGLAGQPRVVVDATGCARDGVSAGGRAQPPLWDPGEWLIRALRRDLMLSPRYR
jgi:hypothetical protein